VRCARPVYRGIVWDWESRCDGLREDFGGGVCGEVDEVDEEDEVDEVCLRWGR
jgi:hypothetical protein